MAKGGNPPSTFRETVMVFLMVMVPGSEVSDGKRGAGELVLRSRGDRPYMYLSAVLRRSTGAPGDKTLAAKTRITCTG